MSYPLAWSAAAVGCVASSALVIDGTHLGDQNDSGARADLPHIAALCAGLGTR